MLRKRDRENHARNSLKGSTKKLGYEQAELEVIADNEGAIALYKKLGFEKYGRFRII